MNNGPLQIFDLLLGNISGSETQSPNKAVDGNIPDMLFGNILSGLIDTPAIDGEVVNEQTALLTQNTENPDSQAQAITIENETKPVHRFTHVLSELNQNREIITDGKQEVPAENLTKQGTSDNFALLGEVADNVTEFNQQLRELLPGIEMTIADPRVKQILSEKPVTIPEGEFEIIDAKITGSNVELTISSPKQNSEPIQVILPKEEFERIVAQSKTKVDNPRVGLDNFSTSDDSVETLLSKLNLKKIEVRNINDGLKNIENQNEVVLKANTKEKPAQATEISLLFEESETGDLIKKRINPRHVKTITRSDNNSQMSVNNKSEYSFNSNAETNRSPLMSMATGSRIKNAVSNGNSNFNFESLTTPLDNSGATIQNEFTTSNFGLGEDFSLDLDVKSTENGKNTPVRFTLPDDIRTALKPGGKSVTFTIEPENIGQAKLSLSLHDNGLRARVIVENPQAKMLMENSIDQLIDQLNKADIKVESIEVSVGGQNSQNQFFDRRPQWSRNNGNQNNKNPEVSDTDRVTSTAYVTSSEHTYISQSGVNLLA